MVATTVTKAHKQVLTTDTTYHSCFLFGNHHRMSTPKHQRHHTLQLRRRPITRRSCNPIPPQLRRNLGGTFDPTRAQDGCCGNYMMWMIDNPKFNTLECVRDNVTKTADRNPSGSMEQRNQLRSTRELTDSGARKNKPCACLV
jgi:hypothetical protein